MSSSPVPPVPGGGPAGTGTSAAGRARVAADAAARGLSVQILERGPSASLADAAAALGISPADIVKSLVVRSGAGGYLFALIPGDRQISWPKLRAAVGVNRLSMPAPELALAATGYQRGTITPLGSSTAWPVFADAAMAGRRVAMGAGEHGYSLFVDADELITALAATVADISGPYPTE